MTLAERLQASVQAIKTPDKEDAFKSFWHNWRGTGDGNDGNTPCIALVEYARSVGGNKDDDSLKTQLGELDELVGREKELDADTLRSLLGVRNGIAEWQEHLTLQLRAIAATVRAATLWNSDQSAAKSQLETAAKALNMAFPLSAANIFVPVPSGSDPAMGSKSAIPLLHAALAGGAQMLPSTYLWLAWLLRHLFQESQPSTSSADPVHPATSNTVKMLLVRNLVRNKVTGDVARVQLDAWHEEAVGGLFFCPLALGVTPVDPKMTESVKLAGRVARQSLDSRLEAKYHGHRAVRIAPEVPFGASSLKGPSAGGLLAGAALMTAMGKTIDITRTASVALKLTKASEAKKENDDLKPDDLELEAVKSVAPKLDASGYASSDIKGVALHPDNVEQWKEDHPNSTLTVQPVSSLDDLFRFLQGDAWYEDLLRYHAEEQARYWAMIESGNKFERDRSVRLDYVEHRPDLYVPPRFSIERTTQNGNGQGEQFKSEPVTGKNDAAYQSIWNLAVNEHKQILLYDEVGSGKTVSSLRMVRVLTHEATATGCQGLDSGRHRLVVRWEGSLAGTSLGPLDQTLANDPVVQRVVRDPGHRRGMIEYALKHKRVVIILDGLDQFSDAARRHVAQWVNARTSTQESEAVDGCRWIITAREGIYDEMRSTLFADNQWLRVKIMDFDVEQQDKYFQSLDYNGSEVNWKSMLAYPEQMQDLLRLPLVLRMIRGLIENAIRQANGKQPDLPHFESFADLFSQVAKLLLSRAISRMPSELESRMDSLDLTPDMAENLLVQVLGLLAFQMALNGNWDGKFTGDHFEVASKVSKLKFDAATRFHHNLDCELSSGRLSPSQRRIRERELERDIQRWGWAIKVLEGFETSHRAVNEVFQPDRIQFSSRKMMEGYAALYLSRYATDSDLKGNGDPDDRNDPAAWSHIADWQWEPIWRVLIEMPRWASRGSTSQAAVSLLFYRVRDEGGKHGASQLRPTELIVRAWHHWKRKKRSEIEPILRGYRSQYLGILNGDDLARARLAAELLPFPRVQKLQDEGALTKWTAHQLKPWQDAFVLVQVNDPPNTGSHYSEEENHGHQEGKSDIDRNFWFATACVSRDQYRLFCPNQAKRADLAFPDLAPSGEYPTALNTWWDAVALGLWLGDDVSPPTASQWNAATTCSIPTDAAKVHCERRCEGPLPVRLSNGGRTCGRCGAASDIEPDPRGIWHAYGNMDEWCISHRPLESSSGNRCLEDLLGSCLPKQFCVKGGSWASPFGNCKADSESRYEPAETKKPVVGIRLCGKAGG